MKRTIASGVALFAATSAWAQNEVPKSSAESLERLSALVERYQRVGVPGDAPNGYDTFIELIAAVREADIATWREPTGGAKDGRVPPSFAGLYNPTEAKDTEAERACAREAMKAYGERGVFEISARLPGVVRAARPRYDTDKSREHQRVSDVKNEEKWDGRMVSILLPDLGKARNLARIQMARMAMAIDAGDSRAAVAAFEESMAIARIVSHQGTLIDRLVAIAIDALAADVACKAIGAGKASKDMLDGWEAAAARQLPLAPAALAVETERLNVLDAVRWAYDGDSLNPKQVAEIEALAGEGPATDFRALGSPPATPAQTARSTNALFDRFVAYAQAARTERAKLGIDPDKLINDLPAGEVLLRVMAPVIRRPLNAHDQMLAQVAALRAMILLERHRLAHGVYPGAIAELGAQPKDAITDPFSGRALGYILVDAKGATPEDAYVLYSTGVDGEDNGGKQGMDRYAAMTDKPEGKGLDFILTGKAPPQK